MTYIAYFAILTSEFVIDAGFLKDPDIVLLHTTLKTSIEMRQFGEKALNLQYQVREV
jgi:hypothetical protein